MAVSGQHEQWWGCGEVGGLGDSADAVGFGDQDEVIVTDDVGEVAGVVCAAVVV
ncbi:MAG: hypothetical protein ACT4NY_13935 [Pseudonocardiales bacterium]